MIAAPDGHADHAPHGVAHSGTYPGESLHRLDSCVSGMPSGKIRTLHSCAMGLMDCLACSAWGQTPTDEPTHHPTSVSPL
jgi:hypothetical protein